MKVGRNAGLEGQRGTRDKDVANSRLLPAWTSSSGFKSFLENC